MQIFKVFKCILKVVKYCSEVKKKHFNKYLVITKKDEDFEISNKIRYVVVFMLTMMLKKEITAMSTESIEPLSIEIAISKP